MTGVLFRMRHVLSICAHIVELVMLSPRDFTWQIMSSCGVIYHNVVLFCRFRRSG